MNENQLNLIQAEIDGVNSPEDSDRVRRLIETDDELRSVFQELQSVRLAIESMGELDPPARMKANIIASLPEPARAVSGARRSGASIWTSIADLVRLPKPASLAYAFSLGLVVAFVVSSVLSPQPPGSGIDSISGTMIAPDFSGFEIVEEIVIEEEEEKVGTMRIARDERQIIVEFVWNEGRPVEARVSFDEEWLDVRGTRSIERPRDFRTTSTEEEVEFSGSGPIKEYVSLGRRNLEDDDEDTELNINVRTGGRTLLSRSLMVPKRR